MVSEAPVSLIPTRYAKRKDGNMEFYFVNV
jgi:hypothetical protein